MGVTRKTSNGARSKRQRSRPNLFLLQKPRRVCLPFVVFYEIRQLTPKITQAQRASTQYAPSHSRGIQGVRRSQKRRNPPSAMDFPSRNQPANFLRSLKSHQSPRFLYMLFGIIPLPPLILCTCRINIPCHRFSTRIISSLSQPRAQSIPFSTKERQSSRPLPPRRAFHPANLRD